MIKKRINWFHTSILTSFPFIGIWGLFTWIKQGSFNWNTVILSVVLYCVFALSVTAGYHRLFAHRAYKAHWLLRLFLIIFAAGALQGPAILWSVDHRNHHAFTDDEEKDPYSIKKGFFWAHMGWILYKHYKDLLTKENAKRHKDLFDDKLLLWQMDKDVPIGLFLALLLPALIAMSWGDFFGGLFVAGFFRTNINHHATFLVNSLAHYWGTRPYDKESSGRQNLFVALFTFGEGYHNYHHVYPSDYRNGDKWYHWDPTKWFIKLLSFFGLAYELKFQKN